LGFDTNAKQGAAAAKVRVGRVVKSVPFEYTAFIAGTEILELAKHRRHIRDAQFDFDFAVRSPMSRHRQQV
jgi:hypothetical protein